MVTMDTGGQSRTPLVFSSDVGSYIVEDLEPFTEYSFLIEACTIVGCNESDVASVLTLEDGMYVPWCIQGWNSASVAVSA